MNSNWYNVYSYCYFWLARVINIEWEKTLRGSSINVVIIVIGNDLGYANHSESDW